MPSIKKPNRLIDMTDEHYSTAHSDARDTRAHIACKIKSEFTNGLNVAGGLTAVNRQDARFANNSWNLGDHKDDFRDRGHQFGEDRGDVHEKETSAYQPRWYEQNGRDQRNSYQPKGKENTVDMKEMRLSAPTFSGNDSSDVLAPVIFLQAFRNLVRNHQPTWHNVSSIVCPND